MPQCEGCGTPFLLLEKAQCGICILRLDAMKMVGQPLADDEEYWQEYPQCKRCGGAFAGLDARICGRCAKLAKAVSDVDRQQIMQIPQCKHCGCSYSFVNREGYCGACARDNGRHAATLSAQVGKRTKSKEATDTKGICKCAASSESDQLERVKDRAAVYDQRATDARLSQSKSKATTAKAQSVKERVATMKELRNGESIYIGFYFLSGGSSKKQISDKAATKLVFNGKEDALKHVLETALASVKSTWTGLPAVAKKQIPLIDRDFKTDNVTFFVAGPKRYNNKQVYNIELQGQSLSLMTVGQYYQKLVLERTIYISEGKDGKETSTNREKLIVLHVCVYTSETDSDYERMPPPDFIPHGRASSRSASAKSSITSSTSKTAFSAIARAKRKRGESNA
ncbi:hypothetical protein BD311DRAFT_743569, partial [Dichomitus squalens]